MNFSEECLYHIYNRGNNKQTIFFEEQNYIYFLELARKFVQPKCDILAWCLMPNHFHLLVHANYISSQKIANAVIPIQQLSEGIRMLLSSYTKAINKKYHRTGNLFQQRTKSKCIDDGKTDYGLTTFHYIHQNPWKAGLVNKMEEWPYSSFSDYAGLRNGKMCNKILAAELLDLNMQDFLKDSYKYAVIDENKLF